MLWAFHGPVYWNVVCNKEIVMSSRNYAGLLAWSSASAYFIAMALLGA